MDFQKLLSSSSASPKSIMKAVISFSVVLLVIWLFMVSRMQLDNTGTTGARVQDSASQEVPAVSVKDQLLKSNVSTAATETEAAGKELQSGSESRVSESPDVFQNALTTFIILVSILGGVWLYIRKKQPAEKAPELSVASELGTHDLGEGNHLKFLEINGEVWVMGVNSSAVNLIQKINKEEWQQNHVQNLTIPGDNEHSDENSAHTPTTDFKSFYKLFRN